MSRVNKNKECSVIDCSASVDAKNLCHKHYERLRLTGSILIPFKDYSIDEWILQNIHIDKNECWIWLGATSSAGYPRLIRNNSRIDIHRWFYEKYIGSIPHKFHVDHLCRTPSCVNPSHLEAVTSKENILRGVGPAAINNKKTHCIHGHEFTVINTYIRKNGSRQCKTCVLARTKKKRSEK